MKKIDTRIRHHLGYLNRSDSVFTPPPIPIVLQSKMSTSSSTSTSASSTAARNAKFAAILEEFDGDEIGKFYLYITKQMVKEAGKKTRAKREPKLDEDGNVVKRELSEGAKLWNSNVSQLKQKLTAYLKENSEEPDSVKVSHKSCMRLASILKAKAEALGEGEENIYYPIDKMSEETMLEEWEAWNSLPEEEKYPKKKASDENESESEEEEKVEKKGRGRPKKQVAQVDSEAEAEVVEVKPAPKAKKVAVAVDSEAEAEAPTPKAKAKAKKVVADSEAEAEPEPKPAKKAVAKKGGKKGE